ncbi:carboxypeptidase inhibitor SmCI-like [Haliotis rubra]|uniref:carboxypeptidase inhibitor SmCI-like n=1 Tax=Haliotis rubra TaxID=36100 RepID=UPI001EE6062E|nr:carboxypeptidase inhibitor SmCI-like [Haliotis rubra]
MMCASCPKTPVHAERTSKSTTSTAGRVSVRSSCTEGVGGMPTDSKLWRTAGVDVVAATSAASRKIRDGDFPRWWYNKRTNKCQRFIYGGCEGNANNFQTLYECRFQCRRRSTYAVSSAASPEIRVVVTMTSRWWHNKRTNRCQRFSYGGCEGNANNFETLYECRFQLCQLPKDTGPCRAYIPQYYFNSKTCLCEKFVYGGCGGNANRFETLEDCRRRCGGGDLCSLPKDPGQCAAAIRRWWYNKRTNKCQRFIYGGCPGNANNFQTLYECRFQCQRRSTY